MPTPIDTYRDLAARHQGEVEALLRHAIRYYRLLETDLDPQAPVAPENFDDGEATTARASKVLRHAEGQWAHEVREPPGFGWAGIDTYIRDPMGLGWTWVKPYERNGQFAWCGAFAAWCYGAAGLARDVRFYHMASTIRLVDFARGTPRLLADVRDVEPGDIAIVGDADHEEWGQHIVIVRVSGAAHATAEERASQHGIDTFEGNARGTGPDGSTYEGVITRSRPFASDDDDEYRVLHGIRMLESDWEVTP